MRIQWQKFLAMGVLSALGALTACQVEVIEGPPGTGGTGGSAGTAGAAGAKGDAAQPETGSPDAPRGDAPSSDGPGADALPDVTGGGDGAVDAPSSDRATMPDAVADALDASMPDGTTTGDAMPPDGTMTDGSMADAAPDATGGCFAEDPNDAGTSPRCSMLPYFGTTCRNDAGLDGPPAGASLCETLEPHLKTSALVELFDCLKVLPGGDGGMDACSAQHDQGSADCSRSIFGRSMCAVPDGVVDGGVYGCAEIAASCGPDSGDGGIPVSLCRAWLGPFNATTRQEIIDCYLGPDPIPATSCRDKFENYCVFQ